MRLATFEVDTRTGPVRRVGVRRDGSLVDVTAGYAQVLAESGEPEPVSQALTTVPPEMIPFLRRGDTALAAARDAVELVETIDVRTGPDGARLAYDLDEVDLCSPIPRPNSLRDCIAFEEHLRNSLGDDVPDVWYEMPVYYKSNPDSVIGPDEPVQWPSYTEKLDYELELGVVIGKRGRDIPAEEAETYIAGYTVFDDFSARDIQLREMEVGLGPSKGKDFANALGPYLTTADSFDPTDATMRASVNGEVWSEGNAGSMYHSFAEIIEHVSMGETIYPGDVIGSGTVGGGCGLELDRWLSDGDVVELEIEGIGVLRNTVER